MAKHTETKNRREFKLSTFAVDNGTSIFILTLMILIFGIQGYQSMPKEQYPEAYLPQVYINTPYFGNSAPEIENLVTRPIEKEIKAISGIKNINSTSIQDFSVIIAEFDADMTPAEAVLKVKDAVDKSKSELPNDLDEEPKVTEILFSDFPIMTVNVSGDYSMDELRSFAEYLEDELEEIKQISRVDMKGAVEREVKIDVDLLKMKALQVSFMDIEGAISAENLTLSGGELINNDFKRAMRIIGQFERVEEIERVIVKSEIERPIYLKDLATIQYDFADRTSYARSDGLPVISLDVIKGNGENLLHAADNIKDVITQAEEVLPEDIRISIFNDQSINTRNEVSNLENSIISGVILVTLVLLFFLGLRNAAFVGMAIPLSMLTGILFLYLSGVTMNIVVLFALILALGLLVDNAIVVVENIYRYMQEGYKGWDAAKYGAGEVAMPIIASTATTLAAFVPLAFWPGLMGMFMKYMPITLIIVLASSLFVALVINPVFTSRFMRVDMGDASPSEAKRKRRNVLFGVLIMVLVGLAAHIAMVSGLPKIQWLRNLMGIAAIITLLNFFVLRPASFAFQNNLLPVIERVYDRFIRFALRRFNPLFVFLGTFLLLFIAIGLLMWKSPKVEYFPSADPVYVNVFVELPLGTDIEATNLLILEMEDRIVKTIEPYTEIVESVLSQIGENTGDPNRPPEPGVTPNKARLTVSFIPSQSRGDVSSQTVMEKMRESVYGFPGTQIIVDKNPDGPPTGYPINLELRGDNIDTLAVLSKRVISYLNKLNVPGVEELKADVQMGKPELLVHINREAARRYSLSTGQIASAMRTSVFGKEISKFKQGEDEYPIQLRADLKYRNNINDLLNQPITFQDQARQGQIIQVPISAVADFENSSTYTSIKRRNQTRVITVYSNVIGDYNAIEIVSELKSAMDDYPLPRGFTYEFTGQQEQQAEDMAFLLTTFLVAVFAIFLIIVAQFNSVISPFIIILSVLFSTIGVFLGYVFSGMTISIILTGVGIISLTGVVVNNAIVLIDYINLLIVRKRNEHGVTSMNDLSNTDVREAIVKGGATRLRPVLLTAITTVLGLIPLAIGFNFNFFSLVRELDPKFFIGGDNTALWGPMAWTVIYGLIFATFLTLVVVPVMYWLAFRMQRWAKRIVGRKPQPQTG